MILVWEYVFFIVDSYNLRSRMDKMKKIDKSDIIYLKELCIKKWLVHHEKKIERTAHEITKHLILQGNKSKVS